MFTYLLWPADYVRPADEGHTLFLLHTPVLGGTFGIALLALGIGLGTYIKRFFPLEVAVQQRQDGPSDEFARKTTAARFEEAADATSLPRRSLVRRAMLAAVGWFGVAAGVLGIGGFVSNPWKGGDRAVLRMTDWLPLNGETVYLRGQTGVFGEVLRIRPEDLEPGSMQTVFPFRESDRGHEDLLLAAEHAADAPVMLIRLRPAPRSPSVPARGLQLR